MTEEGDGEADALIADLPLDAETSPPVTVKEGHYTVKCSLAVSVAILRFAKRLSQSLDASIFWLFAVHIWPLSCFTGQRGLEGPCRMWIRIPGGIEFSSPAERRTNETFPPR